MREVRRWRLAHRAALAAAAGALAALAWNGHRALREPPLPAPPEATPRGEPPAVPSPAGSLETAGIVAAVARDPFNPARRRPAGRYEFPGEAGSRDRLGVLPDVRIRGLAARGGGRGLVALQVGDSSVRLLRVGESHGGLELMAVRPGGATFAAEDTTVVLPYGDERPAGPVR